MNKAEWVKFGTVAIRASDISGFSVHKGRARVFTALRIYVFLEGSHRKGFEKVKRVLEEIDE